MSRARFPLALAALALLAAGCDSSDDNQVGDIGIAAEVTVESAHLSRCNEMMSFAELSFTFTIENTSADPIVVDGVAFDGTSADGDETYATGDAGLSAPVTLPAGASARFRCRPDVPLTWSPEGADGAMAVVVGVSVPGGGGTATAEGVDTLRFIEAWDNCDTFATTPYPCEPIPAN